MSAAVLDSSAVLAAILGEPGGDIAHDAMASGHIALVNLAEVYTKLVGNGLALGDAVALLARLELRGHVFSEADALQTAALRPLTMRQGLSLGDRACIALGQRLNYPVVTADRRWAEVDFGIPVHLIR